MKKIIALSITLLTLLNCKTLEIDKETYKSLPDGLYGNLTTSKGDILVKFEDEKSPVTVANFVGLAEGKIENKAKKKGEPFYDGTIFHRVIKDFMSIQEKEFFLWLIPDRIPMVLSFLSQK